MPNEERYIKSLAGEYSEGALLTNYSLIMNSDGAFTSIIYFDTGVVITQTGESNFNNNILNLVFDDNENSSTKLSPVIWGNRKYLFNTYEGSEEIHKQFCEGVVDGNTVEKENNNELFFIYLNKDNISSSISGQPKYLDGELFCP